MIKEITKTVTEKKKFIKQIKCDVCGKVIADVNKPKIRYWELTTHHNDWGFDSVDSYEQFDLCSQDCIRKKLEEYLESCKTSDTQEFELEQTTSHIKVSVLEGEDK